MNRNLTVVLLLVVAGFTAAGVVGYRRTSAAQAQAEKEIAALRLRAEALERVGWIRSNPDAESYKNDVKGYLRWYFEQVSNQQAKYGGNPGFDDYLKDIDRQAKAKAELDLPQLPDGRQPRPIAANSVNRKAFWEWEKSMFDRMRTGKYAPVLTGTDKGLRLDVVSADVVMTGNKPKIRFPMVLWGAQREVRENDQGQKRVLTWADFATTFRLLDDKGKLYGEMSTGNPGMRNDFPERLIAEFPPQTVLGQYELDPVPANVSVMEMQVAVRSHSPTGGDINAQYSWKVPVPDDWKLKPGEALEGATVTTRSEEEIDPAVAARKEKK